MVFFSATEINNLKDLKASLAKAVVVAFIVLFSLASIILFFAHANFSNKQKLLTTEKIGAAIELYHSYLSEKFGILGNSNVFIDYLRSGEVTRGYLLPQFLYQLKTLETPSIVGMAITNKDGDIIFSQGEPSAYYMNLEICYLNRTIDSEMGNCRYLWAIYFSKQELIKELQKINENIGICENCNFFDLLAHNKISSFPTASHSPLLVGLSTEKDTTSYFFFYTLFIFLILVAFTLWISLRTSRIFNFYIDGPLTKLTNDLRDDNEIKKNEQLIQEFCYLHEQIESWQLTVHKTKEKENEARIGSLLKQILHDIRSPLSAIKTVFKDMHELPENKRTLLQNATNTLNDLVNNILDIVRKNKRPASEMIAAEPLAMLLSRIVSEKRLLYQQEDVAINFNVDDLCYCLFANLNQLEFKRAISNLVNNAIEATQSNPESRPKTVEIRLKKTLDNYIHITIKDNGCGIQENNLPQVLQGGFTDKVYGTGVGLSSAKKLITSWEGSFELNSRPDLGTSISVKIPIGRPANWFVDELHLFSDSLIIIVDDDSSTHQIWDERFNGVNLSSLEITVKHLYSPDELVDFIKNNSATRFSCLIDFEYTQNQLNGLELIEKLDINHRSILVTNRYDSYSIREKSSKNGIKILPKTFSSFIPIKTFSGNIDLIFIDDNISITRAWELAAKVKGKSILTYNSANDFNRDKIYLHKNTPIYIDANLNHETSGEELAKQLAMQGFTQLYLATGYEAENFKHVTWVKSILNKDFPF